MPTTIDKQMLKQFRKDFDIAIAPLQKKYGILLTLGGIRFDASEFSGRYSAILTDAKTLSSGLDPRMLKQKLSLEKEGSMYGGIQGCFGKVFSLNNKRYILVGLRTNSRKNPLCIQSVDTGKNFISPLSDWAGNDYSKLIKASKLTYDFESREVKSINN